MKLFLAPHIIGALLLLLTPRLALAKVESLEGATLGERYLGPERTLEELKGHVVLWENFGYRCGACVESLPHLVALHEQWRAQGLVVVGAHVQAPEKDGVVRLCRTRRVSFSVRQEARLKGDDERAYPRAWLFDASGRLVKEGPVLELASEVERLVREQPHWIARGRKLASAAKAVSDGLKQGRTLGWALSECESLVRRPDEKTKEEAGFLKAQLEAEAERLLAQARAAEAEPDVAHALWTELRRQLRDHAAGKTAAARLAELAKDEAAQRELAAAKRGAELEELAGQLVESPDAKFHLDSPQNVETAGRIREGITELKEKHGSTRAARRSLETLGAWGFQ